jgi:hypothetical protein
MTEETKSVEVSRRIEAPAAQIFEILATPQRHKDFDGSGMLQDAAFEGSVSAVGDTFNVKMHRLGRNYLMINHVVEFEPDRRIFWEPAPGDVDTAGGDPSRIGVPAGYRWGYILAPDGLNATMVTEVFYYGTMSDLLREGGQWINGSSPVARSMSASVEKLEKLCTDY